MLGRIAAKKPGALTQRTIMEMQKFLGSMSGEGALDRRKKKLEPVFVRYLTTVLRQAKGGDLGARTQRELLTLATAIDKILAGEVAEGLDVLSQRFKAVEMGSTEGSWRLAEQLELTPSQVVSSISKPERLLAMRGEIEQEKLRQALGKGRPTSETREGRGRAPG